MTALRVLLRLAARDARRDRGRSLLVLIMVVLPVTGLVGAITFLDTVTPTAQDNADARLGTADALAFPAGTEADREALVAALPEGTQVEVVTTVVGSVAAQGRSRSVAVSDQDLTAAGFGVGGYDLIEGVPAAGAGEVAITTALVEEAGVELGGTIVLEPLGEVVVTAVLRDPQRLSSLAAVTGPGTLEGTGGPWAAALHLADPAGELAVDPVATLGPVAVDASGTQGAEEDQWFVESRQGLLDRGRVTRGERWALVVVGGLAGVEVALVAGAAFAVSVRRRQRELGLLAAGGGTSRHVRRAVLLTGVTVGVGGALLGAAIGVLGAWAVTLTPAVERLLDREVSGLAVDPVWVAACVAIGAAAAIAGAWWPARSVARLPVLTALSGRRPVTTPSRRTALWGLALAVLGGLATVAGAGGAGTVTPFVFLFGSVLVVLGVGMTSPFLLEQLGRLAGRLPTGPRLAMRDAARFRTRNGPIVTASMAGLAASITLAAGLGTIRADAIATYRPFLPDDVAVLSGPPAATDLTAPVVADALEATVFAIGGADVVVVAADGGEVFPDLVTPEAAERLYGSAAAEALARGEVVVRDPAAADVQVGPAMLTTLEAETFERGRTLGEVELVSIREAGSDADRSDGEDLGAPALPGLPQMLLAPQALADLGGPTPVVGRVLLIGDAPFDEAAVAAATAVAADAGNEVFLDLEDGPDATMQRIEWAAIGVGALAGLLIVVVAIALAATEARADGRTLRAVGAGVRTRRSVAAGRALLLSGLGGILAVPVGMVPALAVLSTADLAVPVQVPWAAIAIVAVGVPAVVTLGAVVAASLGGRDRLHRAA